MVVVYLHNNAHNGDVLLSSEIVKVFIRCNPTIQFKIVPCCSSILFQDVVSNNVSIHEHPIIWNYDMNREGHMVENDIECIRQLSNTLISYTNTDNIQRLYINTWCILTNNSHCMDLRCKPLQIAMMLEYIKNTYNIDLHFRCDDYRELIPKLPAYSLASFHIFTNPLKESIFFYNLDGFSGQDRGRYSRSFNDNVINHLLVENPDKQLIIVNKTEITHPNLLTLTTDVNIEKTLCGKNLVYYANICRLCSKVYFKLNGGSLYLLNKDNIGDKSTEYYLLYDKDDDCSKIVTTVFNNSIIVINDYRKFN
jgi:hypothetical protein